jgi:hypothetical protein
MQRAVIPTIDVADDAVFQMCLARTHVCSVNDDHCVAAAAFTDAGRDRFAACFDLDCSELKDCLRRGGRM